MLIKISVKMMIKLIIDNENSNENFNDNFRVTVNTVKTNQTGSLPANPALYKLYKDLEEQLESLFTLLTLNNNRTTRSNDLDFDETIPTAQSQQIEASLKYKRIVKIKEIRKKIENETREWLKSSTNIEQHLRESLQKTNGFSEFVVETNNNYIRKLPWHVWDLLEDYRDVEVTFSFSEHDTLNKEVLIYKPKVLAVMGSDSGIDCTPDQACLQKLEKQNLIKLCLLNQPTIAEVAEKLREKKGWDIFIFSGHSTTKNENGFIFIDDSQGISITDISFAVQDAESRGLKLAIFNSCQGLGIAQNLVELVKHKIPAIIVMREPIENSVAQRFLNEFLQQFIYGNNLSTSVRRAREKLQEHELPSGDFPGWPGSSWLPIILRNPTIKLPLCYNSPPYFWLAIIPLISIALVLGIRHQGWLEPWELKAYDWAMRSRLEQSQQQKDDRLVVVEISDEDIEYQKEHYQPLELKASSLSDPALEQLLQKLKQYNAQTIGLDIYRPFPVSDEYPILIKFLKETNNLFGVCKVEFQDINGEEPPPEIPDSQVTFSDVISDKDDVIRRHLTVQNPQGGCQAMYSFSLALAINYIESTREQKLDFEKKHLKIGKKILYNLHYPIPRGAYQDIKDGQGHQMMLNYRTYQGSIKKSFYSISLEDILKNKVSPDFIKNKIILIGVTDRDRDDYFKTPYSTEIPGVYLHAQMTSQILSYVLDDRPLIWILPRWLEIIWIGVSSLIGSIIAWQTIAQKKYQVLIYTSGIISIFIVYLIVFQFEVWIPVIPLVIAFVVALRLTRLLISLYKK